MEGKIKKRRMRTLELSFMSILAVITTNLFSIVINVPNDYETIQQAKQVPVLINYSIGKKRYEKEPDGFDFNVINKIEKLLISSAFPSDQLQD